MRVSYTTYRDYIRLCTDYMQSNIRLARLEKTVYGFLVAAILSVVRMPRIAHVAVFPTFHNELDSLSGVSTTHSEYALNVTWSLSCCACVYQPYQQ